ncbi:MFS transporter [Ruicaihuangia caeni]|uniref:MFS transporter n=1 Tax=Ruicaihuangia caeni TaxID=3042517 RepID=A0AAW6T147_9MICO|nr:MFS transporter [Klugiella sp. YN-L-19]MDI2097522.1 MFS transporter [Klugiella sp. YN-L-19]
MTDSHRLPLWHGRGLALLSILLIAVNLRSAVAAVSPVVEAIGADIDLNAMVLSVLGTLPPLAFATSGLFSPWFAKRFGLEASLAAAALAMALAYTIRSLSQEPAMFLTSSALGLAAAGVGNVLLPPVVKRYFPDRIGTMTTAYVIAIGISTMLPPALALPLTEAYGWRVNLGVWAIVALVAAVPWAILWLRHRASAADDGPELESSPDRLIGSVRRSRVTWALLIIHGVSSGTSYSTFAWLPPMLVAISGSSGAEAAALLTLYTVVGVVSTAVGPGLAARLRRQELIIAFGGVSLIAGYLGLLLVPAVVPWLWVALISVAQVNFSVMLALINLRTRDQRVTTAVSGFAQGNGYILGASFPFLVGASLTLTGGWLAPLVMLLVASGGALVGAVMLAGGRKVDDELA